MKILGVDVCRAGWFMVALDGNGSWEIDIAPNLSALCNKYKRASLILVDIPIGLKESGLEERKCDVFARRILGQPRGRSVFRVPCRAAVYEDTREDASQVNIQRTGTGISPFTWGIVPKIKEMDEFLNANFEARAIVRESHPELCFWALAGEPMQFSKGDEEGLEERQSLLQALFPETQWIVSRALMRYQLNQVKRNDVLDALSMVVNVHLGTLVSIPGEDDRDSKGVRMEMVFKYHEALSAKNVTLNNIEVSNG